METKGNNYEITVVIPVYNTLPFLAKCLDSVRCQLFKNIEVIVVDDGSTDGSSQFCDHYCADDTRFKVIHTSNRGVTEARKTGFISSTSPWIKFVDSDDFLPENALQTLWNMRGNVDVVIGNMITVIDHTVISSCYRPGIYNAHEYITGICRGRLPQMLATLMLKRTILTPETFNIPRKIMLGEDIIMLFNVAKNLHCVRCIPHSVYIYNKRYNVAPGRRRDMNYWKEYYAYIDSSFNKSCSLDQHIRKETIHIKIREIGKMIHHKKRLCNVDWIRNTLSNTSKNELTIKEKVIVALVRKNMPVVIRAFTFRNLERIFSSLRKIQHALKKHKLR